MKKLFLAGIFSTLALVPLPAVAQTDANQNRSAETAKNHATAANGDADYDVAAAPSEAQKSFDAGVALYNSGKLADAVQAFKESNKLRPDDAQTNYMLGMSYWKLKGYYDAVNSFKRAVKIKPDWDEAYFRLGLTYYVLGRTGQSHETYKKLQDLNPSLAAKLWRVIGDPNTPIPPETVKSKPAAADSVAIVPVSTSAVAPVVEKPAPVGDADSAPRNSKNANTESVRDAASTTAAVVKTETPPAIANEKPQASSVEANVAKPAIVSSEPVKTETAAAAPAYVAPAPAAENLPLTEIYRVGIGDVLDIRLLNTTANRSTLYSVIDGGFVDFPIAGAPISVAGLTTKEIQTRIASELKRLAVADQTQIAVGVRQFSSHTVVVTGLVGSPGTKVLRREAVPLYVLLSEIQPRLDAARVVIMRAGSAPQILDLNDASALNFNVRPGDVLNVTARQPDFYYIAGHTIGYPGQKPFQTGITLVQAILAAGGTARDGSVELSREGADGHLTTTKLNLKEIKSGKMQDPKLQPGDRVEILK